MKKLIAVLLALIMALSIAACGNNAPANDEKPADEGDTSLSEQLGQQEVHQQQEAGPQEEESYQKEEMVIAWNPTTSITPWGTKNSNPGIYEAYEMLYECDAKGEMYPLLADATYDGSYMPGCDHEPGSNVYTVKIYDYITDHKGRAVTASDVAYSFMHQLNNESTSGWGDMISVEATDATTVVFTFSKEQTGVGQLMNILCRCFIVNEESHKESPSALAADMCGTGPYKFVDYVSGSSLVLERNEDYWQTNEELRRQEQQANVAKLTYKFIGESSQIVIGLKTGDLSFAQNVAAKDCVDFMDGGEYADKYNVYSYAAKFVYNLVANCSEDSIMNDINMRLAVFNSIDQDGLITALGGTNTRLYSYATSYYTDYSYVDWASMDNYNTRSSVDSDLVKSYLDKAGYKGEKVILMAGSMASDAAVVVEGMLLAQGINCEAKVLDNNSANTLRADTAGWDIELGMMAGDFNVTVWQHGFSYGNVSTGDRTMYHLVDQEWEDMLNACLTEEGHTAENMKAWWEHCAENAYAMGLYAPTQQDIMPEDMTYYVLGDKLQPLTGASIYAEPEA